MTGKSKNEEGLHDIMKQGDEECNIKWGYMMSRFNLFNLEKRYLKYVYMTKKPEYTKDDEIEFINLTTKETIRVKVTELKCYKTFQEMYKDINKELMDCANWSLEEMLTSTYELYTKEQEQKWGTVAIEVEVIA
ncbi:ASC-1 homology (ASCH) domain-containing protein [Bacillus sp. 166amftsu]|nr:ASC-1 homology (ASCH) domain-containing protein [Bacillus sp. 166amftsu]